MDIRISFGRRLRFRMKIDRFVLLYVLGAGSLLAAIPHVT